MKILEDYKKIARELLFEVDDEKIIKYKDEDGESKEMKAGSAKTMPDEHPAKQAYNKMKDDGGDDKEEPSGQKLGGSDFDRDAQNQKDADDWASMMFGAEKDKVMGKDDEDDEDDEFGGEDSEVAKYLKSLQGKEDDEDEWDDTSMGQRNRSYGGRGFGDDSDGGDDKPKADEPKADEPRGAAIVGKTGNAEQSASKLSDIIDDAKDHEGKMPKGVARQVAQYEADILARQGINKSPDGTYSTSDYDEDEDEVIYEPMSEEGIINAIARETGKSKDEVVAMRAMAKESNPGVFPEDKGDDEKSGEESISDEDLKDTILQDLNPSRDSDRDERGLPNSKEDWENEVEEVDSAFKDAMEYYERTKKEYEDESVTDDPEEREYLKDRAQKAEKEFIKRRAVRDAYKEKGETLGLFDHVEPKKKPFLREQLERIGGGKY